MLRLGDLEAGQAVGVLFSGGIDSTVAAAFLCQGGFDVTAIEVDYPRRPNGESIAAHTILSRLSVRRVRVRCGWELPGDYKSARLSALLLVALCDQVLGELGVAHVVIGTIREDWHDHRVPQAGRYYYSALGRLLSMHRERPTRLHIPFYEMTKSEVVRLGMSIGAPIADAWSCIADGIAPCGTCVPCMEAKAATTGGQSG